MISTNAYVKTLKQTTVIKFCEWKEILTQTE